MKGDYDELIFWDKDLGPMDSNLMLSMFYRLLSHDVDVVGAQYCARNVLSYFHGARELDALPDASGLMKMGQIPLGFSKIKRSVFERLHKFYPERKYIMLQTEDDKPTPNMFEAFPTGIFGRIRVTGRLSASKKFFRRGLLKSLTRNMIRPLVIFTELFMTKTMT